MQTAISNLILITSMTLELTNEWGEIHSVVVKDRLPVERVQPLVTGDKAPHLAIAKTAGYWTTPVDLQNNPELIQTLPQLLEQGPVVVGFYCPCWGRYAQPALTALTTLAEPIRQAGGQLIVFSNEHPRYLGQIASADAMTIVYDADKSVARQFGVYSETDPIWDRVSGISEEVYSPALYVVDRTGQIRFHELDENFEGFAHSSTLLDALR